jgi:hypothetical protein
MAAFQASDEITLQGLPKLPSNRQAISDNGSIKRSNNAVRKIGVLFNSMEPARMAEQKSGTVMLLGKLGPNV